VYFETRKELPQVLVDIHEGLEQVDTTKPEVTKDRLSEANLGYYINQLDVFGSAWVRLVNTFEDAKQFNTLIQDYMRGRWQSFAAMPIDSVPPTELAMNPAPLCSSRDAMMKRALHWQVEGFRRVANANKVSEKRARRGYRHEVLAWMKVHEIEKLDVAAKRLGTSKSALKSIMSDRGQIRYGEETLVRILKEIGANLEGE
jgi:hypothetical protein